MKTPSPPTKAKRKSSEMNQPVEVYQPNNDPQLDQALVEIRSGRRLGKMAASIESFLNSQIARIETSLEEIQSAVHNDQIVQTILADFEAEKLEWEKQRSAEVLRLKAAGNRLANGWMELEQERRKFLDASQR